MTFSVIVPVYKNWEVFKKCYSHLQSQNIEESNFEILIINNSLDTPIPVSLKLSANTQVFNQPTPGSYACRNLGASMANGEYLAFTDSDCLPSEDWLEKAKEIFVKGADLIGGKVEVFKEQDGTELAYDFERTFAFNQKKNILEKSQSVTANLFVKKKVFETAGPFKEQLLSGGDFEWTRRAVSSGFKLEYGEEVVVAHPARLSISEIAKKRKRTSGGFYFREYQDYNFLEKLKYILVMGRPRISILNYKNFNSKRRFELFFATWFIEIQGILEILKIQFGLKKAERQ
ncbi:glycosyltransferase [Algoriphagus sediminis]|uniref:Glycosyltransferase family A protein n=1 Tax=Algoriphagus sediminis TaxID=3057113 RepID=A0ABT7YE10_9BACT|nr:glycosyltransferase family A protein [Algoriphagus sediminis]MDN3204759.1 glycosyltransferase family A protein [Algoriphagus sediminis]